jgi:Domain of unknown function DUF29
MMQVLEHLLKLQHAGGTVRRNNARGWQLSVKDAQLVLRKLLAQNPSLRPQLEEMLEFAYQRGASRHWRKARLSDRAIPESCPWAVEQVTDDGFLPGKSKNTAA